MRCKHGRLIFLGETSTNAKMTRVRGRSLKGDRLKSAAPFGRWGTQTFIAGLKCDGLLAPWIINAPMNSVIYIPTLTPNWHPHSGRAMSLFSRICPAIKASDPKASSVPKARGCCFCRPPPSRLSDAHIFWNLRFVVFADSISRD